MTTSSITNDASTLFTEILTLLSEEKSFLAGMLFFLLLFKMV